MTFYTRPGLIILLNTMISTFILAAYQPFGYKLQNLSGGMELLGYIAIVSFLSWLFFCFFPAKKGFANNSGDWTLAKHLNYLGLFLLSTGLCVFYYDFHILCHRTIADYGTAFFADRLITNILGTFSIGLFPLYIGSLLDKTAGLKKDLALYTASEASLTLEGETKECLSVDPEDIIYMESSGNYVDIYYNAADRVERKTLRTTLKGLENKLEAYPYLVRCHRTFLVNRNYVEKLGKGAQGTRLILRNCPVEIPVSRTYLSLFKG